MRNILFVLFILIVSNVNAQDFCRLNTSSLNTVENYIQSEKVAEQMIGVSVGIIKNGEIVFLKGYGYADQDLGIVAEVNTMYRIASVSKSFTAIAALQLWENSQLNLTSDIRNYVPEYPVKPEGAITIEDLLTNESGIQHYSQNTSYNSTARDNYIKDHPFSYDPIAAIDIFKDQSLVFTPGSAYNYSSFGFNLAAAVVERAGNAPFEDQVKSRIIQVADMPFFQPAYRGKMPFYKQATGYVEDNNSIVIDKGGNSDYDDVTFKLGGGGWIATIRDMTHYIKAYIDGDLLNSGTVLMMGANHDTTNNNNYGYGIRTAIRNGDTLLYHSGAQAWTSSVIYFSPENHNGVVILTNNRSANCYPLARLIYDAIPNLTMSGSAYVNPISTTLGTPNLMSPNTGSTNQNSSIFLQWSRVDYTDKYEYEYADNSAFTNSITGKVIDTLVFINELTPNQTYHWRVRAVNDYIYGGISGVWSSTSQFSTGLKTGFNILPFIEDFESYNNLHYWTQEIVYSGLGYQWGFEHENEVGRAKFGVWSITNNGGSGALTLDVLSTNGAISCTNFATLTLDLENYVTSTDLELSFDYIQHGEESHAEDKVWIRGNDLDSWIEIYDWYANKANDGMLKQVTNLDIDSLLSVNGKSTSSTFQLRFGQKDNSYASDASSKDGVTFDNIIINGTSTAGISKNNKQEVLIYPNPTNGHLNVFGINEGTAKVISITSKVLIDNIRIPSSFDISYLPSGLYFILIETQDYRLIRKLIKN